MSEELSIRERVIRVLQAASALQQYPWQWTQGAYAQTARKEPCSYNDENAVCFCVGGAKRRALQNEKSDAVKVAVGSIILKAIDHVTGTNKAWMMMESGFNDAPKRTFSDIRRMWDYAIALAQNPSTPMMDEVTLILTDTDSPLAEKDKRVVNGFLESMTVQRGNEPPVSETSSTTLVYASGRSDTIHEFSKNGWDIDGEVVENGNVRRVGWHNGRYYFGKQHSMSRSAAREIEELTGKSVEQLTDAQLITNLNFIGG